MTGVRATSTAARWHALTRRLRLSGRLVLHARRRGPGRDRQTARSTAHLPRDSRIVCAASVRAHGGCSLERCALFASCGDARIAHCSLLNKTIVAFLATFAAYSTHETLRVEALQLPPGLNLTLAGPDGTSLPGAANASTAAALARQLQLQAAVTVTASVRHGDGSYASVHAFQFLVGVGVILWVWSMALLGPGKSKRAPPIRVLSHI